jgi:LytS/YehU family sensor histidine kinase
MGDLLLGEALLHGMSRSPRTMAGFFLMSLAAGGFGTYYLTSREQLAKTKLAHEEAQRHAAEAQLKLLQTQLEPHMLFNTLANLRVLIGTNPALATDMLDRMVAYLRATLTASRATTHTLQAEFDRLRDYLELMAVRMGPRLSYTLDLPAELAQHPVPTLLLQPLVENAIKHGLEPKVEGGSITVRARQAAGQMTLDVRDTGVGPKPGDATADGFGLAQVRERLATLYPNQGAIELIADEAMGTRASITFPYKS